MPPLARGLPTLRPFSRPHSWHRQFSSSPALSRVQLAYNLHEPPQSPAVRAGKAEQHAPAAPIIFMHGLFGSKTNNRSMSKVLARDLGRPVYAIDLRNHGDSPHDVRQDYTAMAEDVEGFIQDHALQNPTLIGHSMGAKTAMTVALRSPHLVGNLVSVDNAPVDAVLKSDFAKYAQGMRKIEDARITKQSDADVILQEFEEALPIRQFLLTNLIRANADPSSSSGERGTHLVFRIPIKTLAASLDYMADFPFKDPESARFEKPALFVRGTKSKYVADEMLPVIGRFFPRFEVKDLVAGHWVISENPEGFRRAVVEFLRDPD